MLPKTKNKSLSTNILQRSTSYRKSLPILFKITQHPRLSTLAAKEPLSTLVSLTRTR